MCSEWVMCYYLNTKRIEHIFFVGYTENGEYARFSFLTYSPLPSKVGLSHGYSFWSDAGFQILSRASQRHLL